MKIKNLLASVLAIAILIGCDNDRDDPDIRNTDFDMAYVSVTIKTPSTPATRADESIEQIATDAENAVKTMYAVAFNETFQAVQYGSEPAAIPLNITTQDGSTSTHSPDVFKVSAKAKYLLIVANPGEKLSQALARLSAGVAFNTFNDAIKEAGAAEVQDDSKGFTMINVGTNVDSDTQNTANASLCLIDISGHLAVVGKETGQHADADAAKAAAHNNRVPVKIERLVTRVIVESTVPEDTPNDKVLPANKAVFHFEGWVLDVVNSTFYPWAKTVKLDSEPTTKNFYENNFYTIDPNYEGYDGLKYNKLKEENSAPITYREPDVTFLTKNAGAYCLENTMKADKQLYQNATRVIIKATYYPDEAWSGGDWFSFAGVDYESLEKIQEAEKIPTNTNLKEACRKFLVAVQGYATKLGTTFNATKFEDIKPEELAPLMHGGEVVKEDGCIKWYKGGLCYYYYEIRHDAGVTGNMAFGKYGVVRNNIYNLTLNSVKGAGTPWYPNVEPEGGDPDGPQPPDPIDETEGYIGVTVTIGPWIKWDHPMDV